jgi:hypothetical protein
MRNKYPGICYRCGKRVEAGEGHFEGYGTRCSRRKFRQKITRWRVQHAECAIKYRGTNKNYFREQREKSQGIS